MSELQFNCCTAGTVTKNWMSNGKPLVINPEEMHIQAFPVTAGTAYKAGEIVDFDGVKGISLSEATVTADGTMAFLTHGQVNKDLLFKTDGAPADAADFTALLKQSINPVKVSN